MKHYNNISVYYYYNYAIYQWWAPSRRAVARGLACIWPAINWGVRRERLLQCYRDRMILESEYHVCHRKKGCISPGWKDSTNKARKNLKNDNKRMKKTIEENEKR